MAEGTPAIPHNIWSIVNAAAPPASSASQPLIINFEFPVKRAGFRLVGTPAKDDTATLKAFDGRGNLLGTAEQMDLDSQFSKGTFVGLETPAAQGISKVVLDYGSTPIPEMIDKLLFEYVAARKMFTHYVAQIGDGPVPGAGAGNLARTFQTILIVTNPTSNKTTGTVTFFDSGGQPLPLLVDGSRGSSFDFLLQPSTSKTFVTSGTQTPAVAGYAVIQSNAPLKATAIFRTLDAAGNLIFEAAVGSDSPKPIAVGGVLRSIAGEFDTGVAIVNTSSLEAPIEVSVFDESGQRSAQEGPIKLGPGKHLARFLPELFERSQMIPLPTEFKGSIEVKSCGPP